MTGKIQAHEINFRKKSIIGLFMEAYSMNTWVSCNVNMNYQSSINFQFLPNILSQLSPSHDLGQSMVILSVRKELGCFLDILNYIRQNSQKLQISTLNGMAIHVQRHANVSKQTLFDGVEAGPPKWQICGRD